MPSLLAVSRSLPSVARAAARAAAAAGYIRPSSTCPAIRAPSRRIFAVWILMGVRGAGVW